jgi:hypothetical protein
LWFCESMRNLLQPLRGLPTIRITSAQGKVAAMSVLVGVKVFADTNAFTKSLSERADEFRAISERAKEVGAIHHRFGLGDGFVFVNDEWESAAAFEKFFSDPELQAFIGSIGGDPNKVPEITFGESINSADQF